MKPSKRRTKIRVNRVSKTPKNQKVTRPRKAVTKTATQQARTHLRRVKHGRSWSEFNASVPNAKRATLRRFVTDDNYVPRSIDVRVALGLPPFPPLESDLLAIIHGPVRLDRAQKRVFEKDPNKNRGKK